MWILARLIILFGGFYIRYANVFRRRFDFKATLVSGTAYSVVHSKHKGKTVGYFLAVPLESDTVFKITKENETNRLLKSVGFASEIQTGDVAFDGQYYIGSDHLLFNQALRGDPAIRKLIHDIIMSNHIIDSIVCDGHALYVQGKSEIYPHDDVVEMLQKLSEKIKPIAHTSKFQAYKDPFIFKLLIFESVVYALTGYAVEAFMEHMFTDMYKLVTPFRIFIPGTLTGLALVAVLFVLFFKFFRESARSHLVFVVNLVVLLCGTPFWGTKTFVDLNYYLDKSPVITESIEILRKQVRVHRSRKGGTSYTYHWYTNTPEGVGSDGIQVSRDVYESANEGDNVEIKTRKGAMGYPYRTSMNNIEL